jgi:hypothetical protein
MKTKLIAIISLFAFVGLCQAQKETRRSKLARTESNIQRAVDSGHYTINVDKAFPGNGPLISLTSSYTLCLSHDTVSSFLPYFGVAYSAPLSGEGGIKFDKKKATVNVNFKEHKNYTITFKVPTPDDTYDFTLTIWLNGQVDINVNCVNRRPIRFSGAMVVPEQ